MKHGKNLKRRHKVLLDSQGYDVNDFLVVKDTAEFTEFIQKSTGKILTVRR